MKVLCEDLIGKLFDDQIEENDVEWLNNFAANLAKKYNNNPVPRGGQVVTDITYVSFLRLLNLGIKNDYTPGWISDEIIDGVSRLILNEHKKYRDKGHQVTKFFIMGAHFYDTVILRDKCVGNSAKRWQQQCDCDEEDLIFVPYNIDNTHWALFIIDSRNSPAISIDYVDHMMFTTKVILRIITLL